MGRRRLILYLPISFAAKHGIWVTLSEGDVNRSIMWDLGEDSFQRRGCAIPLFLHCAAGNLYVMARALGVILNMKAKPIIQG